MADVFISYAREDRDWVAKLAAAIEAAGYTVWWDRKAKYGAEFDMEIERQITSALAVIVVWSNAARSSPWVRAEARKAVEMERYLPVSRDDVALPLPFGGYQTADLARWRENRNDETFLSLLEGLQSACGNRAGTPPGEHPATKPPWRPYADLISRHATALLAVMVVFLLASVAITAMTNPAIFAGKRTVPAGPVAASKSPPGGKASSGTGETTPISKAQPSPREDKAAQKTVATKTGPAVTAPSTPSRRKPKSVQVYFEDPGPLSSESMSAIAQVAKAFKSTCTITFPGKSESLAPSNQAGPIIDKLVEFGIPRTAIKVEMTDGTPASLADKETKFVDWLFGSSALLACS
jgi:hypothetical protein